MNTGETQPRYGWNALGWKKIERRGLKLQTCLYRAQRHGNSKTVRKLQRRLKKSWSAKLLAVRRVTQDNRGKATAGVDGGHSCPPAERFDVADRLSRNSVAQPVRRVRIPNPGPEATRPLGIPAVEDKLLQVAVSRLLESIYEQDFLPCSYGDRPGVGQWLR